MSTQSYSEIWDSVLQELKKTNSTPAYNLWFSETKLALFDSNQAVVTIASDYKRNIIETKYMDVLSGALEKVIGFSVILYVLSSEHGEPDLSPYTEPAEIIEKKVIIPATEDTPEQVVVQQVKRETVQATPISANKEYTFDNYIVGESNKFAHAASYAVAKNPANAYNPLFIYGESGLGKTHLLYAIMNEVGRFHPELKILYVKGEEFTNELIDSIRQKTQPEFRQKYRNVDVLLIDDIQFIAGKEGIQEEFFHTFNALYESHKQIILAADRPPRDMKQLEDRLRTRFEWGLCADVQPPDYELRMAIMKNKAHDIGVTLPKEVLTFLAENLRSNIRQLEGAVKKIGAMSFISGTPVTLAMAKNCTVSLMGKDDPDPVKADKIIAKVAAKYNIPVADLKSRKRTSEIKNARHICIYIIRKTTDMTLPAIGQLFGRDHTTIMSSISVIENEMKKNPMFEMEISELMKV